MPILTRLPFNSNDKEVHYEALINGQTKNDKNHDTPRNNAFFLIGSTVVVQHYDGGPWTHGTIVGKGDDSHNNRSDTICVGIRG